MAIDWDKMVLAPLARVFAEVVHYFPAEGDPFDVDGVFDEGNKDLDLAGGMGANSSKPIVGIRRAEFPVEPFQGDQLVRAKTGERFVVRDVEEDGHGSVKLALNFIGDPE